MTSESLNNKTTQIKKLFSRLNYLIIIDNIEGEYKIIVFKLIMFRHL